MIRKLVIFAALLLPGTLFGQCSSQLVASGISHGAPYVVFMPQPLSCYNGDAILFAHGYVPVGAPPGSWLAQLQLPDGTSIPQLINGAGFAFAASGFTKDGLAIPEGMASTADLTSVLQGLSIPVHKTFVTGASEGGLIATKLLETTSLFDGGVAVCGPIGSFQRQLNYVGDARVLFDYFFPGILTQYGGDALHIPPALILNWATVEQQIRTAIVKNPLQTLQFLSTSNIPIGLSFANAPDAITGVLWYNVFGANDAVATLGGIPFDNTNTVYHGSLNDRKLNLKVARFSEDPAVLVNLPKYETSGALNNYLVTLHTLADPIVPFWHELLYKQKANPLELTQIPAFAYGHCNVTANEAKLAIGALIQKVGP